MHDIDESFDFTRSGFTSFICSLSPCIHLKYNMLVHIGDISVSFIMYSIYNMYMHNKFGDLRTCLFDAFSLYSFPKTFNLLWKYQYS